MADDSDKPPVAAGQSTPVDLENPLFFSLENRMFAGVFALPSGKEVQGKFDVAGREIRLEVWGGESDGLGGDDCRFVNFMKGTVNDLGDVSLIGGERKLIRVSRIPDAGGKRVYYAVFSLDCVVFGTDVSEHFSPEEETVDEASFLSDDANVLFHDPDVFAAAVSSPSRHVGLLLHGQERGF